MPKCPTLSYQWPITIATFFDLPVFKKSKTFQLFFCFFVCFFFRYHLHICCCQILIFVGLFFFNTYYLFFISHLSQKSQNNKVTRSFPAKSRQRKNGGKLACSAGVFFERAICSRKRHVETSPFPSFALAPTARVTISTLPNLSLS